MKTLIIALISTAFMTFGKTQNVLPENLKELFYKAYTSNSVALWKDGLRQLDSIYHSDKDRKWLLEITEKEYGLVASCQEAGDKKICKKYTDLAQRHAEELLRLNEDWSEAHALLGGLLGFQISYSPMKGMWLGPKSNQHIEKAIRLDEKNPFAWFQKGSSYYHSPSMFGGDIGKSVESFEKSESLYEQNGASLDYNWQYLDALVWLGQAYEKNDQWKEAKATYEKALRLEPEYKWVKYQLLPELEKK